MKGVKIRGPFLGPSGYDNHVREFTRVLVQRGAGVTLENLDFTNLYGTDVTAERAIVKFPDQNPNPVMRIRWDGSLVYANPASAGLVAGLGLTIGVQLPSELAAALLERVGVEDRDPVEVTAAGRSYALLPVDVPGFGFINVYGTHSGREDETYTVLIEPNVRVVSVQQGGGIAGGPGPRPA